ncbi:MAG: hypothetical protein LAT81_03370 [Oceanicaulis sp.]|nr:hypothetical protein [Oceanicaulis sp.]
MTDLRRKNIATLGLRISDIDFTGFEPHTITMPRDVAIIVPKIAGAQDREGVQKFIELAL